MDSTVHVRKCKTVQIRLRCKTFHATQSTGHYQRFPLTKHREFRNVPAALSCPHVVNDATRVRKNCRATERPVRRPKQIDERLSLLCKS